jgi:hypothetical protein
MQANYLATLPRRRTQVGGQTPGDTSRARIVSRKKPARQDLAGPDKDGRAQKEKKRSAEERVMR